MDNASLLPRYNCYEGNLSKNSTTAEYWNAISISEEYEAGSFVTGTVILLFFLIGLPANVILVGSILHQRLYKDPTHILLLNLGISDLLVCLLVMPPTFIAGFAGGYIFGDSDYTRCQVCQTGLIYVALTVFAVNILGLISVDRFIFIKFPLKYNKVVTARRIIIAVIVLWIVSILESIIPLFGFGEIKYAFSFSSCSPSFFGETNSISNIYYVLLIVGLATIPVIVIIVTNVWIACIVRQQVRKLYRTKRSYGNKEDMWKHHQSMKKEIRKKRNQKQLVLIRAFGAILLSNFISWIPLIIHTFLFLVVDPNSIPLGVYIFVYVSFISHSVLHPIVEGCFIPEIKTTYKKIFNLLFCKIKKRRQDLEFSSDSLKAQSAFCCDICSFAVLPEPSQENTLDNISLDNYTVV